MLSLLESTGRLSRWRLQEVIFDFEVVPKVEIKTKDAADLWRLETDRTDETLPEHDIAELVASLVQHIDPHHEERDRSAANQYCVCESCSATLSELQNAWWKYLQW